MRIDSNNPYKQSRQYTLELIDHIEQIKLNNLIHINLRKIKKEINHKKHINIYSTKEGIMLEQK